MGAELTVEIENLCGQHAPQWRDPTLLAAQRRRRLFGSIRLAFDSVAGVDTYHTINL